MTDEAVGRIRDAALRSLHPQEIAEIEQLQQAEKVAADAVRVAAERIATRAGLMRGMDGKWYHPSETTPAASAKAA